MTTLEETTRISTVDAYDEEVSLADACDAPYAVERLKAMIDELGPGELYAVTRYVLFLRSADDLFSRSLDEAPLDDEDFPPDDDDDDWDDDLDGKETYTLEEVKREFGL